MYIYIVYSSRHGMKNRARFDRLVHELDGSDRLLESAIGVA